MYIYQNEFATHITIHFPRSASDTIANFICYKYEGNFIKPLKINGIIF